MGKENRLLGVLMIAGCGFFWGTAGLFSQYITTHSKLVSMDLVSLKIFFGFIAMLLYILIKDRKLPRIDKRGLCYCVVIGLIGQALYNLCMLESFDLNGIPTTTTLIYTSPIFVMIVSRVLFKIKITPEKMLALAFCVIGVFLAATGGSISSNSNSGGVLLLLGIGAGVCLGCMNLLNKQIVNDYNESMILTYTLGFAFLFSLFFSNPLAVFHIEFNPLVYVFIVMLGLFPTAISHFLYIKGLSLGVESNDASIISAVEVPVSVIGSVLIFAAERENLTLIKVLGIVLVLASVILLNKKAQVNLQNKQN
jgi:drug/metabolite transporter (DMT)-like permease